MASEENILSEIDLEKKQLKADYTGRRLDACSIKTLIQHAEKL